MLRALLERGIAPDLVVGTSVGAINGAAVAAEPTCEAVSRAGRDVGGYRASATCSAGCCGDGSGRSRGPARTCTATSRCARRCTEALPIALIEDLPVRFQCVAASIEAAAEHWFRPARSSTPCSRLRRARDPAAGRGRRRALHRRRHRQLDPGRPGRAARRDADLRACRSGAIDRPLAPPRWPWEVGLVAFEIARRHRFLGDLASLPDVGRGARAADRRGPAPDRPGPVPLPRPVEGRVEHRARVRRVRELPRRARRPLS